VYYSFKDIPICIINIARLVFRAYFKNLIPCGKKATLGFSNTSILDTPAYESTEKRISLICVFAFAITSPFRASSPTSFIFSLF